MTMRRGILPVICVANLLLGALLLVSYRSAHIPTDAAAVRALVKAGDLTPEERTWEKIGWVTDIDQALYLSRLHRRPAFILVGSGELGGRC